MELLKKFKIKRSDTSNINGVRLKVPSSFEGVLPVSPSTKIFDFEPYSFYGLKTFLDKDYVVFDIGSSYGVMSALISSLIGEGGKVFAFEANSEILNTAEELISANSFNNRVRFHNYVVGNYDQKEIDFYVIPGHNGVASSLNENILNNKEAKKVKVPTIKIDNFCEENHIMPNCIKIDVEGAEFIVLDGMRKILEVKSPDIVLETHGLGISGIEGSLKNIFDLLDSYQYLYFDMMSFNIINGKEFTKKYVNSNGTVLVSKKLRDDKFVKFLKSFRAEILEAEKRVRKYHWLARIRNLTNLKRYDQVITRLEEIPLDSNNPEGHYYFALALHTTGKDYLKALRHYTKALEQGFEPFWVYYNRGSLYNILGETKKAFDDLKNAEKIDPAHKGVKSILSQIEE